MSSVKETQNLLAGVLIGAITVGVMWIGSLAINHANITLTTSTPLIVISKEQSNLTGKYVGNLNDDQIYKIKYTLRPTNNSLEIIYLYSNNNYDLGDTLKFNKGN